VAFLCLAFALLMVENLRHVEHRWNSVGQLSVYVVEGVDEAGVNEVVRALRATSGVASARHVSAETARSEMLDATSSTLLESLPSGAFPDSIEVELDLGLEPARVGRIVAQLRALPSVESVETYASWTARVSRFVRAANVVAVCLTLVV